MTPQLLLPVLFTEQLQPLLLLRMFNFLWLSSKQCLWNNHWICALTFQKSRGSQIKQWRFICAFFPPKVGSICFPHPVKSKVIGKSADHFVLATYERSHVTLRADFDVLSGTIHQAGRCITFSSHYKRQRSCIYIYIFPIIWPRCAEFPENQGRRGKQDREEGSTQARDHTCFMAVSTFISLYIRTNRSLYDFMTDTSTN